MRRLWYAIPGIALSLFLAAPAGVGAQQQPETQQPQTQPAQQPDTTGSNQEPAAKTPGIEVW